MKTSTMDSPSLTSSNYISGASLYLSSVLDSSRTDSTHTTTQSFEDQKAPIHSNILTSTYTTEPFYRYSSTTISVLLCLTYLTRNHGSPQISRQQPTSWLHTAGPVSQRRHCRHGQGTFLVLHSLIPTVMLSLFKVTWNPMSNLCPQRRGGMGYPRPLLRLLRNALWLAIHYNYCFFASNFVEELVKIMRIC